MAILANVSETIIENLLISYVRGLNRFDDFIYFFFLIILWNFKVKSIRNRIHLK